MQSNEKIIIGIDVSKKTLDICLLSEDNSDCIQLKSEASVIRKYFNKIIKKFGGQIYVGLENTGFYNFHLYQALEGLNVKVYIFNPLHLNKSMGMLRGKTDKVDANRIANYLKINLNQLQPSQLPSESFRQLKMLFSKRNLYVEHLKAVTASNKEITHCFGEKKSKMGIKKDDSLLKMYKQLIKEIENEMMKIISQDEALHLKVLQAMSVPGVGKVLAIYLTIKTNGFTQLTDSRKLACFAGVVPFQTQSGTSLNKRPKVSYMADKQMKRLLHMAAIRVVQLDGDLKDYFIRKVKEGKNKMSVINAIRNKIVARVCSCINNEKMYEKKFKENLVLS